MPNTVTEPQRKKRKKRMRLPNGLGSVHKINDGKNRRRPWRARVPAKVDFDVNTGKAIQKYITIGYFENEIDAIEALMEYRKDPYTLEAATCTFADVFEMWKAKKYPTISKSGQNGYEAAYKNSIAIHDMKMRDIRALHLEAIMQTIPHGYQVQTRLKTFWGQVFKYAMEHDIITKNYSDFVTTRDKDPGTTRSAIPEEDVDKIWKAAVSGDHDAQIAMIYIYTGMRASELLEVEKANIDLENRILIGGLKTDAGRDRHIPIHTDILPFLSRLMATDGDLLIMRYDKVKPAKYTYNRFVVYNWNPLLDRLGLEKFTPHYARHTCATIMREAGIEEDIRKLILGHSTQDITDRYTHIKDHMLVEAMDKIPHRK